MSDESFFSYTYNSIINKNGGNVYKKLVIFTTTVVLSPFKIITERSRGIPVCKLTKFFLLKKR